MKSTFLMGMACAMDLTVVQDMEAFAQMREGQTEFQNLQLAAMTNNRMLSYAQLKWDESLAQTIKKTGINDEDIEDINREDEYSLNEIKDAGWGDREVPVEQVKAAQAPAKAPSAANTTKAAAPVKK